MDVEQRNLIEVERLNQRGGRMLSIIDLVEAGTIGLEMAAFCRLMILNGSGWLTAAMPGGAGKTTIMASLLAFLPPGEQIVSVRRGSIAEEASERSGPATVLAHEISPGRMPAYIWGQDVADFFALARRGDRCVSCLHTGGPDETEDVLRSLEVSPEDMRGIGLHLDIHVSEERHRVLRRVRALHCRVDGRLRPAFRWRSHDDSFESAMPREELAAIVAAGKRGASRDVEAIWAGTEGLLRRLRAEGVCRFEDVRGAFVERGPS